MRIGIDASKLMPPRDGIGTYTRELLRALLALGTDDAFHLYGLLRPLDPAQVQEVLAAAPDRCHLHDGRPGEGEVDVFHATAHTYPIGFGGPVVFTAHDLTFLTHPHTHTLENKVHCTTAFLEALLGGARFLAVSRATAAVLGSELGVPDTAIRVIPSAAAPCFAPMSPSQATGFLRRRLDVASSFVLAVGTREPRKNLRRLIAAHQHLAPALRERFPLVIAGSYGWGEEDRELPSDVHLLGPVKEEALVALYTGASLFVYPSLAEGFGLPVLEAMACGAPVITSDRSSLPEVAGKAARLVDPEDTDAIAAAMAALLEDRAASARLRARGLERAATFSWQRTARETLDLYRAAAGR